MSLPREGIFRAHPRKDNKQYHLAPGAFLFSLLLRLADNKSPLNGLRNTSRLKKKIYSVDLTFLIVSRERYYQQGEKARSTRVESHSMANRWFLNTSARQPLQQISASGLFCRKQRTCVCLVYSPLAKKQSKQKQITFDAVSLLIPSQATNDCESK